MKMAKVFYARPGDALTAGWYYSIELAPPCGPYLTGDDAGRAARAEIVADVEPAPDLPHQEPAPGYKPRLLNDRELAAVLAGLRCYQKLMEGSLYFAPPEWLEPIRQIANCGDTIAELEDVEIDALCERLNSSE